MTEIVERGEVAGMLADPRYLVPEADASSTSPFGRFRTRASRFANGAEHDRQRLRLERLLEEAPLDDLADQARARTRAALARRDHDLGEIAQQVPVASLAAVLGFSDPDALPALVAQIAARYAGGTTTDAAAAAEDAAIERLLAAAPPADDGERALRVQLLVQSFAATAGLIEGAMRRLAASVDRNPRPSTREVLLMTLREESPVPVTRRIAPDGRLVVLRLDGPDADADTRGVEPRTLAFGSGPRACPAPHHALAIAAAIVDELRRPVAEPAAAPASVQGDATEPDFDAEEAPDADVR